MKPLEQCKTCKFRRCEEKTSTTIFTTSTRTVIGCRFGDGFQDVLAKRGGACFVKIEGEPL